MTSKPLMTDTEMATGCVAAQLDLLDWLRRGMPNTQPTKREQQQAMDLEFRQAGVNPHDTLPLLGRRVWIPPSRLRVDGTWTQDCELEDECIVLGALTFDQIDTADLVVIPAGMEHRYTARVRTAASRAGIGILFESDIDALTEANSQHAACLAEVSA